ncbi:MAG TPA: UpxY family transcription antiterminator [Armatimonadota bacterium]|nr:UpxY family transcription antiterminator [Armatimonadota bacterium]
MVLIAHAGASSPTEMAWWREGRECWYALYTRSQWERRVSTVLSAQSLETYLPMHRVWDRHPTCPKEVEAPVFPGYLFVRCELDKEVWLTIKKTMGVVRILGVETEPVPVPDYEIESLRKVLAVRPNIQGHSRLRKGDTVQVVKGPLQGVIGTLVEIARNRHKLIISVDVLNRAVSTNIDASLVEPYNT